jgi:transcriptional regulator with PAS, ATPase and Fis domain
MTDQNKLFEDVSKLNALYEELCWGHDDELVFTHENGRVVIYNKTLEKKQ